MIGRKRERIRRHRKDRQGKKVNAQGKKTKLITGCKNVGWEGGRERERERERDGAYH